MTIIYMSLISNIMAIAKNIFGYLHLIISTKSSI